MERKVLTDLGLEQSVIEQIMTAHGKTVTALQEKSNATVSALKEQITQRDNDLAKLRESSGDNTELKKKLDELTEQYEAQLEDIRLSAAIKLALAGKVHDTELVTGLLDKEKIKLDKQGDIKNGLDDQLDDLQKSKSFLFVQNEPEAPKASGIKPADGISPAASGARNPFSKDHFNLTEQGRIYRENPEKAKQLAEAAGATINI